MEINKLLELYALHPNIKAAMTLLEEKRLKNIFLSGLSGSSGSFVTASLFGQTGKFFLCILNDLEEAGYFYHDLSQLLGDEQTLFFPSGFRRSIRYGQADPANHILRTEALTRLQQDRPCLIVTYPEAIAEKVVSRKTLLKSTLKIAVNEQVDTYFVTDVLYSYGFDRVDYVYEPGQFAVRGSIIDVFSYSNEYPYRIDFFGNEVESIRTFEVESQLSKEHLREIYIIPGKAGDVDTSLLSYLPEDALLVMKDRLWVHEKISFLWDEAPIPNNDEAFQSLEEIRKCLLTASHFHEEAAGHKKLYLNQVTSRDEDLNPVNIAFQTELQPAFRKNFDLVAESFSKLLEDGYQLFILSDSEKQTTRIRAIFEDRGNKINFTPILQTVHEGFSDRTTKICCFTDHQLFDRYHKYNLKSDKARSGKISLSMKELRQFQVDDFVVHVDHGIGRFGGLVRTNMNGNMQEVIKLHYLNGDTIYVSIHSLHKLSKYKGKDGTPPKLNKLGSGTWESMKERTKKKVKDLARDLIQLYSRRIKETGFAFSPDTYMQQELEASFIYEDTPDQLKATNDVKQDMEKDRPMDRLICGDVGFGKTEVAIRAAFKAVADSKQVAVLAPTTVLAFQHYRTFTERLAAFPCNIDYLSRSRKSHEVSRILADLSKGKIDILIGTHRIVSKDVKFKDLGLLIIDEEQKFGVAVKERLKQNKINVDTLTLTATPIPRTLQFSLLGARDLSSITTPPPNRYPIQTEIHRYSEDIIREVINFEMSRNGQVFIINNRIEHLTELEHTVKRLVPDARIAVGHGRTEPKALERIISDFANYEYDVLIATSIIESGLDIPNANTIIVNNAHFFGLSDLHQLRGRVGRSNRKAFCYLLSPPLHSISQESRRRLQAIENLSELGSGIHIAMQDLDIRGAGDMLGGEQSGFISELGYETYQKILDEAVQELKNEEFTNLYKNENQVDTGEHYVKETVIDSDLTLSFPASYIPNDSERILLYRELDKIDNEKDLDAFSSALEDRFGKIPEEGRELIRIVHVKWIARKLGVERLTLRTGKMNLYLVNDINSPYYQSEAFGRLLHHAQLHYKICTLKETNNKRMIGFAGIGSVEKACEVLRRIVEQNNPPE
ncbi:MAG: transcription-repair coupling factor [Dysgonamonadaceae bacterium]|nr:transcription-repair coupling factor [Dysgonamonadaceae bacterium]